MRSYQKLPTHHDSLLISGIYSSTLKFNRILLVYMETIWEHVIRIV